MAGQRGNRPEQYPGPQVGFTSIIPVQNELADKGEDTTMGNELVQGVATAHRGINYMARDYRSRRGEGASERRKTGKVG